jgi:hypothetical protein
MKKMVAVITADSKRSGLRKSKCAHGTAEDLGPLVESMSLVTGKDAVLEELAHQFPEVVTVG